MWDSEESLVSIYFGDNVLDKITNEVGTVDKCDYEKDCYYVVFENGYVGWIEGKDLKVIPW